MRIAVSWVCNEADIIASTVEDMACHVDHLLVADHGSTDGTREILHELAKRLPLTVLHDDEPGFHQERAMNDLVDRAGRSGATWIVPFDADEIWRPVADLGSCDVARFDVFDHVTTSADDAAANAIDRQVWRRPMTTAPGKVAFRWRPGRRLAFGNHGVSSPGRTLPGGVVHHFPNRSPEQLEAKIRRGAAGYRPGPYGRHWSRMLTTIESSGIEDLFARHFTAEPADLVLDPVSRSRYRCSR